MIDIVDVNEMYNEFKIPKGVKVKHTKSGQKIVIKRKPRSICAPHEELKREQRRILDEELSQIKVHDCAYGFVHDRSIVDNAKRHVGSKNILSIDMKDFFTTVTEKQVLKALVENGMTEDKAKYITKVCTRFGVLPQGAPTSPVLSNIVAKPMDKKLDKLCKDKGMVYTRYADDITISGEDSDAVAAMKGVVNSTIHKYGWKVSGSKVHMVKNHKSQEVTGVVANTQTNTRERSERTFRNLLHRIECAIKDGVLTNKEQLEETFGRSIGSLTGYANFLYQTNDKLKVYGDRVKEIRRRLA